MTAESPAIQREQMFRPLLRADPTFEPVWLAFLSEWENEKEQPLYLALADLARHLIGRLERGDTIVFDAVFDVVERWDVHGDSYVKEAASIGLLEDLQNGNLHHRTHPSDFQSWLRPESKRWWDKLNRFWEGDGAALGDDS